MKTGPKPKPVALRALEGGTAASGAVSKRPLPQRVELGLPLEEGEPPPEELGPVARKLWEELVVALIRLGVVTTADRAAVTAMCQHWQLMQEAQRVLAAEGLFQAGSRGQMAPHAAMRIFTDSSRQFLRYAAEFGLTPSSRVSLGVGETVRQTLAVDLEQKLGGFNPRRTGG